MKILVALLLLAAVNVLDAKKILLLPFMTPSHLLQLGSIGDGLLKKGHEVHMLVHSGQKVPGNIIKWGVKIIRYQTDEKVFSFDTADFQLGAVNAAKEGNVFATISKALTKVGEECLKGIENKDLFERLKQERFDFAVVDGMV